MMFEYFCSSDGHFGLVNPVANAGSQTIYDVRCPTCGARYRLLERLSSLGQPVARK